MRRRDLIAGTAALLVSPRRSWAQGRPRRIGYLDTAPLYLPNYKVWQDSMRDHGWIEGKNLIVDYRSAENHAERLAPLANELAALKPDVLVGPSTQIALALKSATASIPIVFLAGDPVRVGLVQSLSHPGGNVTGLTSIVPGQFVSKGIQILREDGSCRLKNCDLDQSGQSNSQVAGSRGVARNCSEAGGDFLGTGGDHGGGTRRWLCLRRRPARRCDHPFCR